MANNSGKYNVWWIIALIIFILTLLYVLAGKFFDLSGSWLFTGLICTVASWLWVLSVNRRRNRRRKKS